MLFRSREYLSTSPVRDNVTNSFLTEQVANPFYPLLPGTSLSGNRVQRQQLLRPYPHFTQVSTDTNEGYSWYHSMQIRFEKRMAHGLMSSVSYTWSKLMEANSFLNPTDPRPEEVISASDRTNRLAWTWIYELPFGRGRRFGSGWGGAADKILGGWQIQGIYTLQSGIPLGFGNAIFNGDLKDIRLPAGERTVDRYFNTDAGFVRQANQQLVTATSIRTFPSRFTGIRGPGQNNWDLSVIKNAQLSEGVQLQIRAEAINALNHAQFNNPNTSVTSTSFGRITTEWAWPRVVQLGMKILF